MPAKSEQTENPKLEEAPVKEASKPASKPAPEKAEVVPEKAVSSEPSFSVERLIKDAQPLTGYPVHIVAGALATWPDGKEATVSEVKSAVNKFLNAEVQEG